MRILYVSDVYFPRINGVSTSVQTFRHELARLGHESALVCPEYPGAAAEDSAHVIRIPARYIPLDPEDRAMHWAPLKALDDRLREERFDLVHVQTPFFAHYAGLRFARSRGVPCVATYHTLFEEYLFHYAPFMPKALMRAFARRFSRSQCNALDRVVVPSTAMRDTLARYGVTAPASIVPTGIRLGAFDSGDGARFRREQGIPAGRPMLLFVGRVAFEKNIDFLLRMLVRVLARMPDTLLVVTGDGPAVKPLKRLAAELDIERSVRFIGYLDRTTTLLDCYRAADAFVFASRTETQGLVLLEAMALGVPVISTAVMGTCDIVGAGRGALVAPDDEAGFAATVLQFLDDRTLRERLAREARPYAEEWRADVMARRMANLYGELLKASPGRGTEPIGEARPSPAAPP